MTQVYIQLYNISMGLSGGQIAGIFGGLLLLCIFSIVISVVLFMVSGNTTNLTKNNVIILPGDEFDQELFSEDELSGLEDEEDMYALLPEDQYLLADDSGSDLDLGPTQVVVDESGKKTQVYLNEEFDFPLNADEGQGEVIGGDETFVFDGEEF